MSSRPAAIDSTVTQASDSASLGRQAPIGVTVAIAAYNASEKHIDWLFETLSRQTTPVNEIVVTDDSSTETVAQVVGSWKRRLPIAYERNPVRLGLVKNWNLAVGRASQPLVVLAGQDDGFEPGFLEIMSRQFTAATLGGDLLAVGCGRRIIDAEGRTLTTVSRVNDRSRIYPLSEARDLDFADLAALCLRNGNAFGEPSCVMFRKTAWRMVGGYDEGLQQTVDLDFDLRIAERGRVRYLAQPLVMRRRHKGNQTETNRQLGVLAAERQAIWQRYAPLFPPGSSQRKRVDAAQLSYLAFDALTAIRFRRWNALGKIPARIVAVGYPGIGPICARFIEIVTRRNCDAGALR